MDPMVEVQQVVKNFKKSGSKKDSVETIPVLRGINLTVQPGDYLCIMGKSGCGKSTLLKHIGLLQTPTSGKIIFQGQCTAELWKDELSDIRRRKIGFVFQEYNLMEGLSVEENIMVPLALDKVPANLATQRSEYYMNKLEIGYLAKRSIRDLSGGEKQRAAICRALVNDPVLVLADEPTGNLDSKSGSQVMEVFDHINHILKKAILMVTHDPKVASCSDKVLFMKDGVITTTLERSSDSKEKYYQEILRMQ